MISCPASTPDHHIHSAYTNNSCSSAYMGMVWFKLGCHPNMRCFRCFTRFINYIFRWIPGFPRKQKVKTFQPDQWLSGPQILAQPGGQIHSGGSQPLGWLLLLAAAGLDVGQGTGAEIRTLFFSFSCRIPVEPEYSSMFFNRKTQNR